MQEDPSGRPPLRVALLSPSGWGNLGDAAIQDAVIQAIRRRDRRARIEAFTLRPSDTRRRHGIEADVLSGFGVIPGYRVEAEDREETDRLLPPPPSPAASDGEEASPGGEDQAASPDPSSSASVETAPPAGVLRRLAAAADDLLYRILLDTRYLRRLRRKLKDFDLVLVSGGGQVDAEWGGAFGHPWTLAKWSLLCRSLGLPFHVLAVGVHHLDSTWSRLFARIALRNAHRVSFRDEISLLRARQLRLVEDAAVVPDLAFAHEALDPRNWVEGERGVVAVGPMSWCDPRVWPRRDRAAYEGYLRRLADFVHLLLEEGRRVILLPGDTSDGWAAGDLIDVLRRGFPEDHSRLDEKRVEIPEIGTVDELLGALRRAELVVTSRLHGLLLAAALGRPTLAVVYDRKVDTLARDLQLGDYLVDIESFDVVSLRSNFDRLQEDAPTVRANLRRIVSAYRRRLDEIFEEVL